MKSGFEGCGEVRLRNHGAKEIPMQRAIKWAVGILCSIAFLCGGFVILHGSLPPASINAWLPAGNLTAARSGAASVLLQDGRLLITGGNGAAGALATTEILD